MMKTQWCWPWRIIAQDRVKRPEPWQGHRWIPQKVRSGEFEFKLISWKGLIVKIPSTLLEVHHFETPMGCMLYAVPCRQKQKHWMNTLNLTVCMYKTVVTIICHENDGSFRLIPCVVVYKPQTRSPESKETIQMRHPPLMNPRGMYRCMQIVG